MAQSKLKWPSDGGTTTITYQVHKFNMGDVEDPDIWAGSSFLEWEKSEAGQWVMKNSAPTASWHRIPCDYGWQYQIKAYFTPEQLTYFKLKYE